MYPNSIAFGIDLYTVFLCVGIIGAVVVFRLYSDKNKNELEGAEFLCPRRICIDRDWIYSAVFFQALYDIESRGKFIIDQSTGATFYGGLIGGTGCFIALYFGIGHFVFKDKRHLGSFFDLADIAAASIAIAHGFGRIGCLMAGCCHGKVVDAWYTVYMPSIGAKAVPLQLYEALFLFALFGFFTFRVFTKRSCNLPLYMSLYGVWRFVIEYFRTDDRGSTLVDFLSPSQFIAVLMVLGSIALFFAQRAIMKKNRSSDIMQVENE